MKCQATKVYVCENREIARRRCDEDAREKIIVSPSVKQLDPLIDLDKETYHLCAECTKARDDYFNNEEKRAYEIIFGG